LSNNSWFSFRHTNTRYSFCVKFFIYLAFCRITFGWLAMRTVRTFCYSSDMVCRLQAKENPWFQTSAVKQKRPAIFWDITQSVVTISYRSFFEMSLRNYHYCLHNDTQDYSSQKVISLESIDFRLRLRLKIWTPQQQLINSSWYELRNNHSFMLSLTKYIAQSL